MGETVESFLISYIQLQQALYKSQYMNKLFLLLLTIICKFPPKDNYSNGIS